MTGYTITDKGTIGIPKEKMEKYLTFLECVDETPELLPIVYKIGTGIHEFVLDIPKILASLKGIKQFVETHRDHIPAKFMKHYTAVLQKYDSLQ